MKYTTLLFDADNTLFDFDAAEASSLAAVCKTLGVEMDRTVFNLYHHINKKCWADFEKGKLPQEEIQFTRFSRFLKRLESDADPDKIGDQYLEGLSRSKTLIEGTVEMLDKLLTMNLEMVVITNGLKQVQRPHFEHTGLTDYFSEIIVFLILKAG